MDSSVEKSTQTTVMTPDQKREARAQHLQTEFPYAYTISLGEYRCNLRCRMCPMYNMPPKEKRQMSDEVMERSLKEVGDRDISIDISAWGETFQHPNADKYLFWARKYAPNASIVVATNGTLLNEERCEKIVDSGIDHLSFSLDANSPETYQWLTGSRKFDQTAKNLENLVKIREKRKGRHLKVTAHIIGIKELKHEFQAFLDRWSGLVDHAYVREYGNWGGLVDENGCTPLAEPQALAPEERYPCAWLWYATKIQPNGDVSKCHVHVTGDESPVGNIMNESFESIWKGTKMRNLREAHLNEEVDGIEHCKSCTIWNLFPNFWNRKKKFGFIKDKGWE